MNDEKVLALRAKNLPRLSWRDVFAVPDGAVPPSAEDQAAMEAYFRRFAKPLEGGLCLSCGEKQGARDVMEAFLGVAKFRWGLAHGEGYCSGCGYPARALHYEVGPINRLSLILQYHPDEFVLSEKKSCPST